MNRMEEFEALDRELDQTPPELEFTVARAKARARSKKCLRWAGIPMGALAGTFAAFVLLINAVPNFALACSNVPFLADLAAAVDWSGSLRAAVENQYVQPIGQSQTANGITVTIDYVIVDQKQVNLFITTENEDGGMPMTMLDCDLLTEERHSAVTYGEYDNGQLRRLTFDFEEAVPAELELKLAARPFSSYETDSRVTYEEAQEQEPAAEFVFMIQFDPAFTASGETVSIGQWVELDGQRVYVDRLEVYPSHASIHLKDHPDNKLRLVDFDFYLEDEKGIRYEAEDGISGRGDPETGFALERRVSSPWFARRQHLTLHITGASWLDEENRTVTVDLTDMTAEGLPEGVTFEGLREYGAENQKALEFRVPYLPGRVAFNLFGHECIDPEGNVYEVNSWGTTTDETDTFRHWFYLYDYPYDTVELTLERTAWYTFDQPVTVEIK